MTGATLTAIIWIGATPPSLNRIAGRGSRHAFARAKRQWQRDLGMLLMAEGLPRGLERVEATAVLTFPTRRRRDEGNYRALIEKSLGDALVEGGWLPDDTPDRFTFGAVSFTTGGKPRTTIELRCCKPATDDTPAPRRGPQTGSHRPVSAGPSPNRLDQGSERCQRPALPTDAGRGEG